MVRLRRRRHRRRWLRVKRWFACDGVRTVAVGSGLTRCFARGGGILPNSAKRIPAPATQFSQEVVTVVSQCLASGSYLGSYTGFDDESQKIWLSLLLFCV